MSAVNTHTSLNLFERAVRWDGSVAELVTLGYDIARAFDSMDDDDEELDVRDVCEELLTRPELPMLYRAQLHVYVAGTLPAGSNADVRDRLMVARSEIQELQSTIKDTVGHDERVNTLADAIQGLLDAMDTIDRNGVLKFEALECITAGLSSFPKTSMVAKTSLTAEEQQLSDVEMQKFVEKAIQYKELLEARKHAKEQEEQEKLQASLSRQAVATNVQGTDLPQQALSFITALAAKHDFKTRNKARHAEIDPGVLGSMDNGNGAQRSASSNDFRLLNSGSSAFPVLEPLPAVVHRPNYQQSAKAGSSVVDSGRHSTKWNGGWGSSGPIEVHAQVPNNAGLMNLLTTPQNGGPNVSSLRNVDNVSSEVLHASATSKSHVPTNKSLPVSYNTSPRQRATTSQHNRLRFTDGSKNNEGSDNASIVVANHVAPSTDTSYGGSEARGGNRSNGVHPVHDYGAPLSGGVSDSGSGLSGSSTFGGGGLSFRGGGFQSGASALSGGSLYGRSTVNGSLFSTGGFPSGTSALNGGSVFSRDRDTPGVGTSNGGIGGGRAPRRHDVPLPNRPYSTAGTGDDDAAEAGMHRDLKALKDKIAKEKEESFWR